MPYIIGVSWYFFTYYAAQVFKKNFWKYQKQKEEKNAQSPQLEDQGTDKR